MKKLVDKNRKGARKALQQAKEVNDMLLLKLSVASNGSEDYHRKNIETAREIENCGNDLTYLVDSNGNKKLHKAKFCHKPLCVVCSMRKYNHESARLYQVVKTMYDEYKFMIGTFTIKNVPYDSVRLAIEELNYAWSKMARYKAIKPYLKGTVKKVECKVGKDGKCNVHIHVLMAVSPSFFYGKNSLNHSQWSKLWTRAVNKGYTPELKVQRKTTYEQLKKTCNYIMKSYICGSENGWDVKDINKVIDIVDGQYRKHLIVYTGIMKEIDNVVNAKYKRKNKVNTGKHRMYGKSDNFDYESAKTERYRYKKYKGECDYYMRQ